MKVLIIDDVHTIRAVHAGMLERLGCIPFEATNVSEGLDVYKREKPTLCICDMNMPGDLDGIEFLKAVREIDENARVVICTSDTQVQKIAECTYLGALDYMRKPMSFNKLMILIDKVREGV